VLVVPEITYATTNIVASKRFSRVALLDFIINFPTFALLL